MTNTVKRNLKIQLEKIDNLQFFIYLDEKLHIISILALLINLSSDKSLIYIFIFTKSIKKEFNLFYYLSIFTIVIL